MPPDLEPASALSERVYMLYGSPRAAQLIESDRAAVREPLETQLDEMRLRLHGQADRIASLEAALHSAERLADARYITVEELEHKLDEAEVRLASAREEALREAIALVRKERGRWRTLDSATSACDHLVRELQAASQNGGHRDEG